MRAAWFIARKDLTLRLRDRSVFIVAIVAPLALAFIFNLVFGGGINDVGDSIRFDYGIVDNDGGDVAIAFADVLDQIASDGAITVEAFPVEAGGRDAVDAGEVDALFILPARLSDAVAAGQPATIEVVRYVDAPTAGGVAESIARRFSTGLSTATAAALTAAQTGVIAPEAIADAVQAAAFEPPVATVVDIAAGTRQLDAATYFVAGLSIFFMFFVAGLGITSMLEERRDGTLARLMAAPIARASILGGKALTSVLIGLAAMGTLVVASGFLMGASWGSPEGVAVLVVAAVLAVVALMSFVGGLAKTAEQAGNLQSIVAVTLGMLGGTFVPIADATSFLGKLRFVTPNAWFLQGLADLGGGSISDTLPAVGVLLAIAAGFGAAAVLVSRKAVAA
jgi:ABC-2 type transport system permease protein